MWYSTAAAAPAEGSRQTTATARYTKQRGDRFGGHDDDPEQRDVIGDQPGERRRRGVEADRIRKLHPPGHRLREVEAAVEYPAEAMGVKDGVHDLFRRVEQREQLQEDDRRREGRRRNRPPGCSVADVQNRRTANAIGGSAIQSASGGIHSR